MAFDNLRRYERAKPSPIPTHVVGQLARWWASTPFSHLDVLVTSPEVLAATLPTLSVVHGPDAVDTGTSVLWGLGGVALPRSFPARALHERSAAQPSLRTYMAAPLAHGYPTELSQCRDQLRS